MAGEHARRFQCTEVEYLEQQMYSNERKVEYPVQQFDSVCWVYTKNSPSALTQPLGGAFGFVFGPAECQCLLQNISCNFPMV